MNEEQKHRLRENITELRRRANVQDAFLLGKKLLSRPRVQSNPPWEWCWKPHTTDEFDFEMYEYKVEEEPTDDIRDVIFKLKKREFKCVLRQLIANHKEELKYTKSVYDDLVKDAQKLLEDTLTELRFEINYMTHKIEVEQALLDGEVILSRPKDLDNGVWQSHLLDVDFTFDWDSNDYKVLK